MEDLPYNAQQISKRGFKMSAKTVNHIDTLIALLPNLHKQATISLTLPVPTASVEHSFSQMPGLG